MSDIEPHTLVRFAELAELGVTAETYAHSIGVSIARLDAACIAQWGTPARAVCERSLAGQPVYALSKLLDHAARDGKLALEVAHMARAARSNAPPAESTLSMDDVVEQARKDHLRLAK